MGDYGVGGCCERGYGYEHEQPALGPEKPWRLHVVLEA